MSGAVIKQKSMVPLAVIAETFAVVGDDCNKRSVPDAIGFERCAKVCDQVVDKTYFGVVGATREMIAPSLRRKIRSVQIVKVHEGEERPAFHISNPLFCSSCDAITSNLNGSGVFSLVLMKVKAAPIFVESAIQPKTTIQIERSYKCTGGVTVFAEVFSYGRNCRTQDIAVVVNAVLARVHSRE